MAYTESDVRVRLNKPTEFFDLPPEVRDMVYAYFPHMAAIHINQDPSKLVQPNVSKVSRRMREESSNVFYGRNKFVLDLRGWKHASFPRRWTPFEIFERWIQGIGDGNAARIRNVTFFNSTFRVNVKISNESPPFATLKLRTNPSSTEVADSIPSWYTFDVATQRAEQGLQGIINDINARLTKTGLSSNDFLAISAGVDSIQPFLCRRMTLGYQGAALLKANIPIEAWPDTAIHRRHCDDCGYLRYAREQDEADRAERARAEKASRPPPRMTGSHVIQVGELPAARASGSNRQRLL